MLEESYTDLAHLNGNLFSRRRLGGVRGGSGLEVCGCWTGAGKISQIPAGAGRERTKISTNTGL